MSNGGNRARRRRSIKRAQLRIERESLNKAPTPDPESPSATMTALDRRRELRLAHQEEFAAGGFPLGDRAEAWDGPAAEKSYKLPDDGDHYLYKDPDKPADQRGSYKLPFVSGDHAVWKAITTIAGILNGAQGGLKGVSASDIASIKSKIESYYAKARDKYGDDKITVPWGSDKAEGETEAFLLAYAELGPVDEAILAVATAAWEAELGELDDMGACANCGHEFGMHPDGGACSMDSCSCRSFAQTGTPEEDQPGKAEADAEALAKMGACADCSHAYTDHLGTQGPCTVSGCDCMSYDQPDSGDAAVGPIKMLTIVPDLDGIGEYIDARVEQAMRGMLTFTGPEHLAAADGVAIAAPPEPGATPSSEWSAIFAPEGKLTSDGRALAPGSITWRDLPLTLMAMIETSEGGHIGAEVAGRIDAIWRDEAAGLIRAKGIFDDGEYGSMIAGLVEDQTLRGVSVDLAIARYETGPKSDWFDDQGNWAPKDQAAVDDSGPEEDPDGPTLLDMYDEDMIAVILEAEIGMTTVCPFPAFAEAKIAMGNSLIAGASPAFWTLTHAAQFTTIRHAGTGATLTASVVEREYEATDEDCGCTDVVTASGAGLVPNQPPAEWFEDPQLDGPTAITITEDGRIYGHAAAWGVCHIGLPGSCRTAPHSITDYRYFHLGEVLTEDGGRVACGQITIDTGHADRSANPQAATAHYDDTGTVVAHVACGEDEFGIWVAGALQPDAPEEKVRLLSGSKLSGDWRRIDGNLELVALLAVNVPGFPVPRAKAMVASIDGGEAEVMTLVAAGIPVFQAELTPDDLARFKALELHADFSALVDSGN